MQKSPTLKLNVLLILFGLLIATLLAEVLFRVGGLIAHKIMTQNVKVSNDPETIILCLGDSSTFGLGASNVFKYSYPSQLQKILNEKNHAKKFKVINLGVPGSNSSQLLNRLRNNILKYKPAIIIVQTGENDYWNLYESNIGNYYNVSFFKRLFLSTELILNYSKLYRFLKLISVASNKSKIVADTAYDDTEMETYVPAGGKRYGFSLRHPANTIAYTSLINDNFTKIVQIAKSYSVKILFLRYHIGGYLSIHFYQEQLFNQLGVPYVNNRTVFVEAQKRGMNPFGRDKWHPGDIGYQLIAKNIYNKMILLGMLKGEPIRIFE